MILRCHDRICRSNRSVLFIIHRLFKPIDSLREICNLYLLIKINAINRRVCHALKEVRHMPLLLLWVGLALLLGIIASSNGRSFWGWFILGIIIDPLLAGLLYWLFGKFR